MKEPQVYIEIIANKDDKAVKRMNVTGKSSRSIERIESGMNRNLNHKEYYTFSFKSMEELEEL